MSRRGAPRWAPRAARAAATALALGAALVARAEDAGEHAPEMSPEAQVVEHSPDVFGPDPEYAERAYDAAAQLAIYGGKHRNSTQRPLLEVGREMYAGGPFRRADTTLGEKNPIAHSLLAYGDWRTAVAVQDDETTRSSVLATRINLDVDWQITATERVHAFFRPLDKGDQTTRWEHIDGSGSTTFHGTLDGNLDAAFFEGELGAIVAGARGRDSRFDLPFSLGLMPMLLQNGVWLEDAVTGLAATVAARSSRKLDISNMDWTFVVALDDVDTPAVPDGEANLYAVAGFVEANGGYWEGGYGYVEDRGGDGALSYHNLTLAFTRRWGAALSSGIRLVGNLGQDPGPGQDKTAHGGIVLVESSFITSRPYTCVPYLNLFAGFGEPESLARDPRAGGILETTGVLFESDGMTGFPTLEASGHNTYGGAFGLEWLFGLKRQLVVEAAGLGTRGDPAERVALGSEYGLGVRFQTPLNRAMILRADGIAARRESASDVWGGRVEFRIKF